MEEDREPLYEIASPLGDSYPWLTSLNKFNNKYSNPTIILVGMTVNLLAVVVYLCSPLRRYTTSVYLTALSLTNFVCLAMVGMNWINENKDQPWQGIPVALSDSIFQHQGLFHFLVFINHVFNFLSIWFVVAFTAELYISMYHAKLHRSIRKPKTAVLISMLLVAIACFINVYSFLHKPGITLDVNGNYSVLAEILTSSADTILTMVLPFALLMYMNVRIIITLTALSKQQGKCQGYSDSLKKNISASSSISATYQIARVVKMAIHDRKRLQTLQHQSQEKRRKILRGPQSDHKVRVSSEVGLIDKISSGCRGDFHRIQVANESTISLTVSNNGKMSKTHKSTKNNVDNTGSLTHVFLHKDEVDIKRVHIRRISQTKTRANTLLDTSFAASTKSRKIYTNKRKTESDKEKQSYISVSPDTEDKSFSINPALDSLKKYMKKKRKVLEEKEETPSTLNDKSKTGCDTNNINSIHTSTNDESNVITNVDDISEIKNTKNNDECINFKNVERTTCEDESATSKSSNLITVLQRKGVKMVICIAVMHLILRFPCHIISLINLCRAFSTFPTFHTNQLDYQFMQLFQMFYNLHFGVTFIIYSACAKTFQRAFCSLPRHMARLCSLPCNEMRSSCCCSSRRFRGDREGEFYRRRQSRSEENENSHLVDICIAELHLSQVPSFAPDFKYISPPCLLRWDSSPSVSVSQSNDRRGEGGGNGGGGEGDGGGDGGGGGSVMKLMKM